MIIQPHQYTFFQKLNFSKQS